MSMARAELVIRGRVQGVFYRQSTKDTAVRLGLTGWARNCPDGSVAALFEGEKHLVEDAISWCRQGPPAARVSSVEVEWQDFQGEFATFEIRRG
ncbi:MAG: acylphosphatase [Gemmatimonadales bacterium]|nr:MAG: acylphosphatase [Gemmatimonadales bacterium]